MLDKFNIIISGVGGQGIITLIKIIDQAAFFDGYDVKSSELHGLAQRGGSVTAHISFGKKVNSPMVAVKSADLIISTELTETLRILNFVSPKTKIIINNKILPFLGGLSEKEILGRFPSKNLYIIPASSDCIKEFGKEVLNISYILGYVIKNKLLPISEDSAIKAIGLSVKEKYKDLNIQSFKLAYDK